MTEAEIKREANRLLESGYRGISNKYCLVSRIDRPNWDQYLAETSFSGAPFGWDWVDRDRASAADFYRRCVSKDKLGVRTEVYKLVKKGGGGGSLSVYQPLIEPPNPYRTRRRLIRINI